MKRGSYVALALLAIAGASDAQYRWRDADGQVNYGDVPPSDARELQRVDARTPMVPNDPSAALPFELRRASARHPAVLYTSGDCPACDNARVYLRQRGIPYSERTVEAPEDLDTLRRLTGSDKVPVLTLGGARYQGFNSAEWTRGLSAAGYPAESLLPPGYAGEPPQPLVARASGPASRAGPAALAR
jgi:glutaredoxin